VGQFDNKCYNVFDRQEVKMDTQKFKRQLDELRTIITDGIAYFTVWRGLMVDDEVSAHALNRYRGMFLPARNALLWATLMQLAKVFGRHRGEVSLGNLLAAAKKDREHLTPHVTEEKLQEIEQQIEGNEDLLDRLRRFRDKRLAHHDSEIKGAINLQYGEIRQLIEEIQSMYNSLRKGHDRNLTSYKFLVSEGKTHTSGVVAVMREERERSMKRFKKKD